MKGIKIMEKIKLKDETILNIENGATERSVAVVVENISDMNEYVEALTKANLTEFEILNDNNLVTAVITNKYLASFTGVPVGYTGNYKITFNFGNVDMVAEKLAELEATQELQDEAITELAGIVAE